jgi:hypothetical protein
LIEGAKANDQSQNPPEGYFETGADFQVFLEREQAILVLLEQDEGNLWAGGHDKIRIRLTVV